MGEMIVLAAWMLGLIGGPIAISRMFPGRSSVQGNAIEGQSGVSAVFWGLSLGAVFAYAVIAVLIVADPAGSSLQTRFQGVGLLFLMLALFIAPMIICGFHKWQWDVRGVEFIGVFRRQSLLWNDIVAVRRIKRTGWTLVGSVGSKMHFADGYIPGLSFMILALSTNRSDLAAEIDAALHGERS